MTEFKVQPKSMMGFVRSLSGLFITRENPHGLSPKELTVIGHILILSNSDPNFEITNEVKVKLSNELNQKYQVTVNYINRFRKKRAVIGNKLHPVFFKNKITIEYGT